jgi:hypothetical protein
MSLSVFKFKLSGQETETVAALWAKQNDYWKLISYDIEPEFDKYRVPDAYIDLNGGLHGGAR